MASELDFFAPLADLAAKRPRDIAVREASGASIRYAELFSRVGTLRDAFRDLGMAAGQEVLFSVRPGIDSVVLAMALHGTGAVIVPCDPRMGDAIFAERLALLSPRWVVAESMVLAASGGGWLSRVLRWRGTRLAPLGRLPNVRFVRLGRGFPGAPAAIAARALASRPPLSPRAPERPLDPALPALIDFTSGTTGSPKAVVHTRRSLGALVGTIRRVLDVGANDTVHSRALHLILPALLNGAGVLIPQRPGGARRTIREIECGGVSHLSSVTSECRELADYCRSHRRHLPGSLRLLLIGGAPVHAPFLRCLREVLAPGTRVLCIYGMTEILPIAQVSLEEKLAYEGTGDLLGTFMPDVRGRIGNDGQLLVSGPALFDRYLGGQPVTEHATGDLARIEDGRLVLLGRAKDMIIRGETNIYPELFEPTIERIRGVRRCALVGQYCERLADERVVLVVEPESGVDADDLRRRLHRELRVGDCRIDAAAMPDYIITMELPEAGRSAKVDKAAIRELVRRSIQCA